MEGQQDSNPTVLDFGDWHLPYVDDITWNAISHLGDDLPIAIRISVARCARVSYQSFETGKLSTIDEDLKLYNRLLGNQPIHASPAEHQATPDIYGDHGWVALEQHGNFYGWKQYRKMLEGESIAPLPEQYR